MSERDDRDDKLTAELGRLGQARAAVEPAPGFTSRMISGARRERIRRRRTHIAGASLAGVAAAAAGAFWLTRAEPQSPPTAPLAGGGQPVIELAPEEEDQAVAALLHLTDVDQAMAPTADWDHIVEPLAPAAELLEEEP
jgi:hypothetical protein